MNEKIGFSIGTLLKPKNIIEFSSNVDNIENVDSIWAPESWGKEAFSTLGALSQVTTKVKLGTSIINIYSRTPATIAMGAISIDNYSGNRMIIGLGTSTPAIIENFHGLVYKDPVTRMKEYIEAVRLLTKSERTNYVGKTIRINDFKILEKSRKDIPIYIAAVNRKMINVGLEYADGLIFYLRPINEIKSLVENIKKRNIPGKENFKITLAIITSVSTKNPQKAKDRAAKTLAFYIAVGKVYYNFLLTTEFKTETEKIYNDYHNHGLERAVGNISTEMLDQMTIYGSVNDCKYKIKQFRNTEIDLPILQINPVEDEDGDLNFRDFLEL